MGKKIVFGKKPKDVFVYMDPETGTFRNTEDGATIKYEFEGDRYARLQFGSFEPSRQTYSKHGLTELIEFLTAMQNHLKD